MALNVIFLLSSITTARLLERKKLRAASVAYSVLFVIMAFVLLFTADVDVIRDTMVRLVGKTCYFNVHFTFLDAIRAPLYGAYMVGAILLTFAVQLAATVFCTAKAIVYHFTKKKPLLYKFRKARDTLVYAARDLFPPQNVNLLYCRMLN